ncbi:MAG: EscU/YscU/HrcU family type III secretion system export apparatus switch protein [Bryobacteraceae bacterium]|nr:EscU/YscU/HrcU family type III secretion system export apparatus switch protein [Bryobacteraceae bacterium]
MADSGQRTEQPTERRVQKAREEGNFAVSKEFVAAIQFGAFVTLLVGFSAQWFAAARSIAKFLLAWSFQVEVDRDAVLRLLRDYLFWAATPLLAAGLGLVALSLAIHLATTRMGFSTKKLTPDFKRLSPAQKLKNLPRQNVPQFFYALILLPVFLFCVYAIARENLAVFLRLPLLDVESGLARAGSSISGLLWKAVGLFLVLGVIDLIRQRRRYRKDLRMSKQEIREEHKEIEGNPHVKSRIRRLQRDLLRRQMMKEVPKATAVVVNPTHYAVAIRYEMETMAAPKVVAKGKNYLALRIRQKALEHQVPIVENPPLAQALYKSVEVGQEIPVQLYRAVAEILAYIYRLMNARPGANGTRSGAPPGGPRRPQ